MTCVAPFHASFLDFPDSKTEHVNLFVVLWTGSGITERDPLHGMYSF